MVGGGGGGTLEEGGRTAGSDNFYINNIEQLSRRLVHCFEVCSLVRNTSSIYSSEEGERREREPLFFVGGCSS